jgi:catecholate siderophore receptor
MAQVLRFVPGAVMGQGEGHRDAPVIRGTISTAAFFVDGVRDDLEYLRDTYNLTRVEILKGPNAVVFGRGAGGGLINQVTKAALFEPVRNATLTGGSFGQVRGTVDFNEAVTDRLAIRLNALAETMGSWRDFVGADRFGLAPSLTFRLTDATTATLSYEWYADERIVDRGVPSQNGLPWAGARSAFFGNPDQSSSDINVNILTFALSHDFSENLNLSNRFHAAWYDKFYINVYPGGPVLPDTRVLIQSYDSSTNRTNWFNQTDLAIDATTGAIGHRLLLGLEFGQQTSQNFRAATRNVGFVTTTNPTSFTQYPLGPVQTDNETHLNLFAVFLQDQVSLTPWLELVAGIRYDRFDLTLDDFRPVNADLARVDNLWSPRAALIAKPTPATSLYFAWSVSYLPQVGDQFNNIDAAGLTLEPERFENFELGAKWDITPGLMLSAALYRLTRDNLRAIDPTTLLVTDTGQQVAKGLELELVGEVTDRWDLIMGFAWQTAEITEATSAAPAGRTVPLVPDTSFNMWHRYQFTPRIGAGIGLNWQSEVYASLSNAVILPSYTRLDLAAFITLTDWLELQVNVENATNALFWPTAHNDNNITPAAPANVRVTLGFSF